jgi:tetratricopeptide (TPR) repeat protein
LLWLGGLAVLAGILGGAYYWPASEELQPLPPDASGPELVIPAEPVPIPVEQLRAESEQTIEQLIQRFPKSPGAHKAAATLYQFLNLYERVTRHWKTAIALDPTDPISHEWLAKVQIKQGDDADAARTLQAAIDAGLGNAEIHHQYAIVLQRMSKLAEAEKVARQALAAYPQHRDLWVVLGQTQVQLNKLSEARASFDAALEIDPASTTAHFAASSVCQRLGDQQAADDHRREVEQARAARKREQLPFDENYERSLRIIVASVFSAAATEYDNHGDAEQAELLCQRAYAVCPDSPDPFRQLANMYHRDGKLRSGLIVQRRLMEIEPDNAANYMNFASLAQQLGHMEEAEAALLATARRKPQNSAVRHVLAQMYFRSQQWDQARPFAEEAARIAPSPEAYQLVTEICRRQGDLAGAAAADEAALKLKPVFIPPK